MTLGKESKSYAWISALAVAVIPAKNLDSTHLRLSFDSNPAGSALRIIELKAELKSELPGGTILGVSNGIQIRRDGDSQYLTAKPSHLTSNGNSMKIDWSIDGVSGTVSETIQFIQPDVAEVTISAAAVQGHSIQVQFQKDYNRYYGVWESTHGFPSGGLDNSGESGNFSGTLLTPNVNYSSGRAPFYMTSAHYGIYVKSTASGLFSFGQLSFSGFSFDDSTITYDVIYGPSYADILRRYNQMAGPAVMPPLWAFGSGWWRDDAHVGFHGSVKNAQDNILDDANQLERLHIPAAWMWVDRPYGTGGSGNDVGWGNFDFDSSFPNPPQMIKDLSDSGINLLLWVANKTWDPSELWTEGVRQNYLYQNTNGSAVDLQRPGSYAWLLAKFNHWAQIGIKGYKIDRGEELEDAIPPSAKNTEVTEFSRLAAESMEHRYGADYFNFARNLNDTGRRYSSLWGGDPQCTAEGLKTSIALGIRAGLIDFPMWGSDTGGIICSHVQTELFQRWFAFSAFSPMMEVLIGDKRTPWYEYDAATIAIAKKFAKIHHELIPYTRSEMFNATQTGMPIMRALFLNYPNDPATANLADEYLFGSEILVAPVTKTGATSRSMYFPEGRWLSFPAARVSQGGGMTAAVKAGLSSIPVFVREGAIVPMGDILQANNRWTPDWSPALHLELYPSSRVSDHFDYFDGQAVKPIEMKPIGSDIQVEFGDLRVSGEIRFHCHHLGPIELNGQRLAPGVGYRFDAAAGIAYIPFEGATKLLVHDVTGP